MKSSLFILSRLTSSFVERELTDRKINSFMIILVVIFLVYAILVQIPTASFFLDEGWYADTANQLLYGKLLHRDVSVPYGPITFYLYAASFVLFGKSFFFLRIVGLFIILLQGLFLFLITRLIIGNKIITILSPIILFISLGMYQGDRITASTLAGLFTVIVLYLHIKYIYYGGNWRLFIIGLFFGLSLLTKHNVFVLDIIANGTVIIYSSVEKYLKKQEIDWAYILLIPCGIIAILLVYVLCVNDYFEMLLRDIMMDKFKYSSIAGIPYPKLSNLMRNLLRMKLGPVIWYLPFYSFFFLIFPVIKLVPIFSGTNQKDYPILLILMVASVQLFQLFPLSEYSHYSRATIVFPALIVLLLFLSIKKPSQISFYLTACALFMHLAPVLKAQPGVVLKALNSPPSTLPYCDRIKRDRNEVVLLNLLKTINKNNNDKMLVVGHHEYLYFFSNKQRITRQIVSPFYVFSNDDQKEILEDIEKNDVQLVIVGPELRPNADVDKLPLINEYIHSHFRFIKAVGAYKVWERFEKSNE